MIDLFEALETTWAVRRFTDEPVTDEEIERCLRAAIQAPSGGNIQPWQFLVLTDAEPKRALGELYRRAYARYEKAMLAVRRPYKNDADEENFARILRSSRHLAEHVGTAPAIVLFLMPAISMTLSDEEGELDVGTPYASVCPAVQNFMVAARGQGIGTVLTTAIRIHQDDARALLGVPERYEIVAMVPMGRPRGRFGRGRRRPLAQVAHWNRYGERRSG